MALDEASQLKMPAANADGDRVAVGSVFDWIGHAIGRVRDAFGWVANWMPRRRLSRLSWWIVLVNLIGLIALIAGVLYVNRSQTGLVEVQIKSLQEQATIIAAAITELGEFGPTDRTLEAGDGRTILRRLVVPTGLRARLFNVKGERLDDTNFFSPATVVEYDLEPPKPSYDLVGWMARAIDAMITQMPGTSFPLYREYAGGSAADFEEVREALRGTPASGVRENSKGQIIVSVAVPVQRFKVVMGALMLSTEGGRIDDIVYQERISILMLGMLALIVAGTGSLLLAARIARPIRQLAEAAETVRTGERMPGQKRKHKREALPHFEGRKDEIGDLARALERMLQALYKRIDAIENFAADVSHELKNPLTSVRSAVETLARTEKPDARKRLMEVIQHDVQRLDRLITDISNASRLDSELSFTEMEPVDLREMIEGLAQFHRRSGAAKTVQFDLDLPPGPLIVPGIESRLGQVLNNLIDNAISFNPRNKALHVTLRRRDDHARIAVEDYGPGVPAENLEQIFWRFYSHRPEHEGFGNHSGLGLSICRQIVEAHGGRIFAENRTGQDGSISGARFVVELPFR